MQIRNPLRLLAVAATAAALVGSATGTGHAVVPTQRMASTPVIKAVFANHTMTVSGPHKFKAGRVTLVVKGHGMAGLGKLKAGYTWANLQSDLNTFGASQDPSSGVSQQQGLAALTHAVNHFVAYGGVAGNHTASLRVPKKGTYFVFDDTNLPTNPHKLTVTGPAVRRAVPHNNGTIIAKPTKRFGGVSTLKPSGWFTYKNDATDTPHFLALVPVKAGTTRKQVIEALNSNTQGPPSFARKGPELDTDIISPGQAMMVKYSLRGAYAAMCFFPDLQTGMPHAMMGMVKIIHFK